jgi:tRNA dimethylallyltransferase
MPDPKTIAPPTSVQTPQKPLLLLGATATGKTAVALELALHLPVEIISIDSALVYRGMDIGTAKPSPQELAQVPHHLINIIDPAQSYSTAQFAKDCALLVRQIQSRNKTPVIVGGTMLYARALMRGLDALPEADPQVRALLDAQAAQLGWPAMHAALAKVDPITANRLPPTDSQRIQRALEVYELTGKPLSSLFGNPAIAPVLCQSFSLEPADRKVLHQRIGQRFDAMLANGFIDEVRALKSRTDLHADLPAIRCVGYRQVWEHLEGITDLAHCRERGIVATRQLAKRQLTWLRSMPIDNRLVAPSNQQDIRNCVQKILSLIKDVQ